MPRTKANHNCVAKKTWIRIKIQRASIWSRLSDWIGYWKMISSNPRKRMIEKPVYARKVPTLLQINRLGTPVSRINENEFAWDRWALSISLLESTTIQRRPNVHIFPQSLRKLPNRIHFRLFAELKLRDRVIDRVAACAATKLIMLFEDFVDSSAIKSTVVV